MQKDLNHIFGQVNFVFSNLGNRNSYNGSCRFYKSRKSRALGQVVAVLFKTTLKLLS